MNYKEFYTFIYDNCITEGCGCEETKEAKYPHKRRDPMGQEDADINNDGKVDLIDKLLKAKRDLYKRYLIAKKKGQSTL